MFKYNQDTTNQIYRYRLTLILATVVQWEGPFRKILQYTGEGKQSRSIGEGKHEEVLYLHYCLVGTCGTHTDNLEVHDISQQ